MNFEQILPEIFLMLMGLAALMYALLDGFDLGVGILLPTDQPLFRQSMIASIGPFWDANETWLVLVVGILLIAFPQAHSLILRELYLPTLVLLVGLILRGVAFDFRAKAVTDQREFWDKCFKSGSIIATSAQGFMLGIYVMGFEYNLFSVVFSVLSALCVTAAYAYIGSAWLVLKSEGELQKFAARKGRMAGWLTALGISSICIINPIINPDVAERWFSLPEAIILLPIPLMVGFALLVVDNYLKHVPVVDDKGCWIPFAGVASIFVLCFLGLAFSFYPYVVPGQLTASESASAPSSLKFVFYGVALVLPVILAYTFFAYRLFRGKTTALEYY